LRQVELEAQQRLQALEKQRMEEESRLEMAREEERQRLRKVAELEAQEAAKRAEMEAHERERLRQEALLLKQEEERLQRGPFFPFHDLATLSPSSSISISRTLSHFCRHFFHVCFIIFPFQSLPRSKRQKQKHFAKLLLSKKISV
jgi:hypothetical protein